MLDTSKLKFSWNSAQKLHLSDDQVKLYGLEENLCRNADQYSRTHPWCWVYDGNQLRAEDCFVPKCSEFCSAQDRIQIMLS